MDFGDKINELLDEAEKNKQSSSNSITARHWAIVYTELEKVAALYQTYLSDSGKTSIGGSE